jgi:hypothetical protein
MGSDSTSAFDGIATGDGDATFETPTHLLGDYYVMPTYDPIWWTIAGVLCFPLPPVGAAMLGWMLVGSLEARPDAVDV